MNLISCNNCAVVLNKDKLHFPLDMYGEDGTIDELKAQYDQEHGEWDVFIPCPVCKEPVFGGSEMILTDADLLEQSFELNLNNYGPEDVERLNDWAIEAYAALDAAQAEVKHLNLHLKATQSGRDAALARLAITEEANSMLLARNKWLEHALEVAGASPQPKMVTPYITQEHFDKAFPVNVPPSQAQPPAPSDTAITYMTGYSDCKEWTQPSQADVQDAARYRWLAGHCRSTSEHWGGRWSIVVDGPAPKSHDSEDDFDAAIIAAIKQGGQHD